jgi:PHD/YefM family antitoxin component YafN of YafNO toxin-antitoxin module
MVTFSAQELIPSSEFAKKFGSYLSKIKEKSVEKLAVLKNNKIEAVIISKDEYERMMQALKEKEAKEFEESLSSALNDVKQHKTYPIEKLWNCLDD